MADAKNLYQATLDANQKLLAWQNSDYHRECDHLMDEVVKAREVLLSPQRRRRYDNRLRRKLGIEDRDEEPSAQDEIGNVIEMAAPAELELERSSPLPPRVRRQRSPVKRRISKSPPRLLEALARFQDLIGQVAEQLPLGKIIVLVVVLATISGVVHSWSQCPPPFLRKQKRYIGGTTSELLQDVRAGHSVHLDRLGLDLAAVPYLFEALTEDERTRFFAESVLEKSNRVGRLYLEDLEAGLEHPNERVRLWAIRLLPFMIAL